MVKEIELDKHPCTLRVVLETRTPQKLWIKVKNATKKNTYYTKRYAKVDGVQTYFIRMPQTPTTALLIIYNDKDKDKNPKRSRNFRASGIKILPLQTEKLHISKRTKSFIRFAQEFSENAGILSASNRGDIYKSNNGKFRIDYFDEIRSHSSKKVIRTPARISQLTGRIEVSKSQFKKYSVPMRMAILLHEFSHYYINDQPSNESEADINSMRMYLALGYPRIDAYNVFLNVFKKSNSTTNVIRFDKLDKFIKNWQYERK